MRSKGLLIQMFLGFLSVAMFGVMAKVLVDRSPQAQAVVRFREYLSEKYQSQRIELIGAGEVYEIRFWDRFPTPTVHTFPVDELAREFRQEFRPKKLPETLVVVYEQTGGGCRADSEVGRVSYTYAEEVEKLSKRLSELAKMKVVVLTRGQEELTLNFFGEAPESVLDQAARSAASLWGGGWRTIKTRAKRRVLLYNGEGDRFRGGIRRQKP